MPSHEGFPVFALPTVDAMTDPVKHERTALPPDPVEGSSGRVAVTAWVDKDNWTLRKTPVPGVPLSFFVVLTIDRGPDEPPAEFDLTGLSVEDIENFSASLSKVAQQIKSLS